MYRRGILSDQTDHHGYPMETWQFNPDHLIPPEGLQYILVFEEGLFKERIPLEDAKTAVAGGRAYVLDSWAIVYWEPWKLAGTPLSPYSTK